MKTNIICERTTTNMRRKSIALFLFLGVIIPYAITAERIYENQTLVARTAFQKKQSAPTTFVLLSSRQIRRLEITIERFLMQLTGSITRPITLRSSSSNGGGLRGTIRKICEIIRARIMELARAIGLAKSIRQYQRAPRNLTLSEDWFAEGLLQGSLLLCDLVRVKDEAWLAIVRYFDTHNVTLRENKKSLPWQTIENFKFLSAINDASKFNERLFKCLLSIADRRERASSFDLSRVLRNLTKDPPSKTVKTFKSRLDRAFLYRASNNDTSSKRLYVLLCHSLVERVSQYDDCMEVLRHLETCVLSAKQDLSKSNVNHTFRIKPWMTAIENLSDCKIYIDAQDDSASVCCNLDRRIPRTTVQRLKYIYEKILDRRLTQRSPLHRVANELGNALSKSGWGRQFIYDLCRYFAIYQEGHRRLNRLARNAIRSKKAATRYKEVFKSLNVYKDGILKKTVVAIGNFHRSVLEMQKFFGHVIGNPFRKLWLSRIIAFIIDLITSIYEYYQLMTLSNANVSIPTDIPSTYSTSPPTNDDLNDRKNQIQHFETRQMRKDKAFEELLQSMNRVSEIRSGNRSTLACLANNLLLIAMFMETLGFVSTMFCLGERKNGSEELKDEWASPGRDRRSLFSTDFIETKTDIEDSLMTPAVSQDLINIYDGKNINFTRNTFMEVINNFYDLISATPRNKIQ